MYKFIVSIGINKNEIFEGVLTAPNKTAIRDQLQFIEDGSRKCDCTLINQFTTNKQSQKAIQVLLANCWASLDGKQYKFLTWLSVCTQSMEVLVEMDK